MDHASHSPDDRERLARWVRDHAGVVRGFLFGLVRNDDAADDLLQETFRRAWQARERYREDGKARSYLLRIADRLAVDYSRRTKRETTCGEDQWRAIEPAGVDADAQSLLELSDDKRFLETALKELSESQRRVLLLRYFGEWEFAEIAALMDCPLGTVLSHCHRAIAKLREIMGVRS